ncbi:MAG TPA: response regulator [Firmicutes bacterium]|nr:response regulator [Bacillota bacterium]
MQGKKILVTDDRVGIRRLLREILETASYRVYTAAGGEEALAIIKKEFIDMVLLDMKMVGMDGMETLSRIKKVSPRTLVALMTAYEEPDILAEGLRRGACCYITKPFDIMDLLNTIKEQLSAVDHKAVSL